MLFYFFLFIVIDSFAANLTVLPLDIIKKIEGDTNIVIHVLPLNIFYSSLEQLYLPATDGIKFIKSSINNQRYSKENLLSIGQYSEVLPDLQLWQTGSTTRIDKDTVSINTNWNPSAIEGKDIILTFDAYQTVNNQLYQVILFTNHIALRCIKNQLEKMRLLDIRSGFTDKPSLCLHHEQQNEQKIICSYVEGHKDQKKKKYTLYSIEFLQEIVQEKNSEIQTFSWHHEVKEYPFSKSMKSIVKHEYIGQDTFLMLAFGSLFFGIINQNNQIDCFKQSFVSQETKGDCIDKQELWIESFAANQDVDKKTDKKRARFFVVLTRCGKILLCDLSHDLKARLITTVTSKLYSHIAFHDNIISLWPDKVNGNNNPVYEIAINWQYYDTKMFFKILCSAQQQTNETLGAEKENNQSEENVNSLVKVESQPPQKIPGQSLQEKSDELNSSINNSEKKEDDDLNKKKCNIFSIFLSHKKLLAGAGCVIIGFLCRNLIGNFLKNNCLMV